MKNILKWLGIVAGGIVGLLVVAGIAVFVVSNSRLNRTYDLPAESITIEADPESLANGEHLYQVFCAGCHGADAGGQIFLNDPVLGMIVASNLTAGEGGVGQSYTDADYERAIRHAVGADGRPLWIMPAEEFTHFSDGDTADIIAYLRSLEPVNSDLPSSQLAPGGRILFVTGAASLLPAETIDHGQPHVASVEPGVTVEYGEYLARSCTGCHGPDYAGRPGLGPNDPPAANITPDEATGLGTWTEEDFFTAMRTGVRPDGTSLSPVMPWREFSNMTDDELSAIWLFLQSLPPVAATGG
ncbi:MAG TPA: c-type cytochrome [Chloroflexi bacterium]|nr:c-type cytochrome [Chloroflexota bacterium]